MNKIEIGQKYEKIGRKILEKIGYSIIEHASKKNWQSHYDFEVKKDGKDYYVEVRGRENGKYLNHFTFSKKKISFLKELDKEVLILCINKHSHILFSLKDIKSYVKSIKIREKIIYIIDNKPSKKILNDFEKKVIKEIRKKYKIDSYLRVVENIIRITVEEFEEKK